MDSQNESQTSHKGQNWLKQNWPNAKVVDVNWTMERYCYPCFVRKYIFSNWLKVSNENGGTYCEPNYYKTLPNNHPYKKPNFFKDYKDNNPKIYNQMDKNNQKALDIGEEKGEKTLVEHMFKHPETGRKLSYGEMRMFYG